MACTTSGLYVSRRGSFHYVVSWEFAGPIVKWTAVVRDAGEASKLIVGEMQVDEPPANLSALLRRQVEERIDRGGWLK
jgi:hypothetical protein